MLDKPEIQIQKNPTQTEGLKQTRINTITPTINKYFRNIGIMKRRLSFLDNQLNS